MPPSVPVNKRRSVPYARGFKPPTAGERRKAVGGNHSLRHLKTSGKVFFKPVPKPESEDDWLAQYKEKGQDFVNFCETNPWLSKRRVSAHAAGKQTFDSSGKNLPEKYPQGKIYIVQLGDFEEKHLKLDDLLEYTQSFFGLPVEQLHPITFEQAGDKISWVSSKQSSQIAAKRHRLKSRYHLKSDRIQLRVDSLLKGLERCKPDDALCLVGLTMYDMYADDTDLFVAGMAAGMRNVGVFSLLRYSPNITFSPELWYDISTDNPVSLEEHGRLLLLRGCRLLVHEIGHLLGLGHCIYFACCMNGSGHLQEDFKQPMFLCPVDLHKLEVLCGFDVTSRYQNLLQFFLKHNMDKEANWLTQRIEFITR